VLRAKGELRLGRLFEPILLQSKIELSPGQAEALGRLRPVPAALAQHLRDGLALHHAEIGRDGACWLAGGFQGEVLHSNEPAFAQNGRALERVAELADIAWPVVP